MFNMSVPQSVKEQTFITVKTDGIQRGLIGEIISRFEKRGLKMVACKMLMQTEETVGKLYPNEEGWLLSTGKPTLEAWKKRGQKDVSNITALDAGKWVREKLLTSLVGKPILAMVWEGAHAVELGRKTVGNTNPLEAQVGTIRGDYTVESYELADDLGHAARNLVHASGSVEEAKKDISIYFTPEEFVSYSHSVEQILYGE